MSLTPARQAFTISDCCLISTIGFEPQQSVLHELDVINFLIGLRSTWISHLPTHTRYFIRWKQLEIDEKNVFFLYFQMPRVRWVRETRRKSIKPPKIMSQWIKWCSIINFLVSMELWFFFSLFHLKATRMNELKITNDIRKKTKFL